MKKNMSEKDVRILVADAFRIAADAIEKGLITTEEPTVKPEKVKEDPPEVMPSVSTKKATTIDDVRAFLTEKSRAGKTDMVKKALSDIKATRISEVKPEDYDDLIARVEYYCGDLDDQMEAKDA